MRLVRNVFTIADLNNWLESKTLIVSHEYQRVQGLWPINARSYFIDTILNGYPFPKITLRQTVDLKTKQSIREIVDGQQRMMTINDFINDKLILTTASTQFRGKPFTDLTDEIKSNFMSYEVSVDTVIAAEQDEVLEIFRRMNSYTLPLNEPEKRHATYQGDFKWFIKDMIEQYTPLFESCAILTLREISRMQDADLMTELCQIIMDGIVQRSSTKLNDLYKNNDKAFKDRKDVETKLRETLDFIKVELYRVCSEKTLKSYSFYSLFSALLFNKWGIAGNIKDEEVNGMKPIGEYTHDINSAVQNIMELFTSLDQRDTQGRFGEFVAANMAATNNRKNRIIRLKWLLKALQNQL